MSEKSFIPTFVGSTIKMLHNRIYAKVGELVQGKLSKGQSFLISGPKSSLFFTETFLQYEKSLAFHHNLKDKSFQSLCCFLLLLEGKSLEEIKSMLLSGQGFGQDENIDKLLKGLTIKQLSNIPHGKGLSSSSADVLGILDVLNKYFAMDLDTAFLYQLASLVDPTDPCLSETGLLFDQENGIEMEQMELPPLEFIYFDEAPDKKINTIELTRQLKENYNYVAYTDLVKAFKLAAKKKDLKEIYAITTQSAAMNQSRVYKTTFEKVKRMAEDNNAGVFVAHSGTMIGLISEQLDTKKIMPLMMELVNEIEGSKVYFEKGMLCKS